MNTHKHDTNDPMPRRGFFKRITAGAVALGVPGLVAASARAAPGTEDGPDWPGTLKGRHRQVVDAYAPNDGFPLAFAYTFVVSNVTSQRGRRPGDRGGSPARHGPPARARPHDVAEIQDRAVAQHSRSGD